MSQLKATYKEIWHIGYPLMLGNLAWTLIGLFDTLFMGWIDDPVKAHVAQAAIGPVSIFYSILFMMGFGYTRGTQILIARRMGEGTKQRVGEIVDNSLFVLVAVAVVLFVLIQLYANQFLSALMKNPAVVADSEAFLHYRIWGVPASFISCVFISFYSGIGKTKILTLSVGLMSIINILLNYLLVFGKFGFPEMGIAGSGLASSLAEWLSVGILFGGVLFRNRKEEFHLFKLTRINYKLIGHMTKVSTPLVLQAVIANGAWFVFFTYIEKMGQNQLQISGIVRQLLMVIGIPVWALGSVTNTLVPNILGQDNFSEVRVAIKKISFMSMGLVGIQCLIMMLFPYYFLSLFNLDIELANQTIPVLWVAVGALFLMSFTNIIFNGLVSLGSTDLALYIEFFVVSIYCIYFLVLFQIPGIQLTHIWTAEWLYWILMLVCSVFMLRKRDVHLF